jgi:hypothetical protein
VLDAPFTELVDDRTTDVAEQGDQATDLVGHALRVLELLGDHLEAGADLVGELQRLGLGRRAHPFLDREETPAPRFTVLRLVTLESELHCRPALPFFSGPTPHHPRSCAPNIQALNRKEHSSRAGPAAPGARLLRGARSPPCLPNDSTL